GDVLFAVAAFLEREAQVHPDAFLDAVAVVVDVEFVDVLPAAGGPDVGHGVAGAGPDAHFAAVVGVGVAAEHVFGEEGEGAVHAEGGLFTGADEAADAGVTGDGVQGVRAHDSAGGAFGDAAAVEIQGVVDVPVANVLGDAGAEVGAEELRAVEGG